MKITLKYGWIPLIPKNCANTPDRLKGVLILISSEVDIILGNVLGGRVRYWPRNWLNILQKPKGMVEKV